MTETFRRGRVLIAGGECLVFIGRWLCLSQALLPLF